MTPTPLACPPRTGASTGFRKARPRTPAWSRAPRSGPHTVRPASPGVLDTEGNVGPGGAARAGRLGPPAQTLPSAGSASGPGARLSSGEAEAAAL